MSDKKTPEKKFRAGRVSVSVWKNTAKNKDGEEFETKNVTIQNRYKDKDGEWKESTSWRDEDLSKLGLLIQKVREYLNVTEE